MANSDTVNVACSIKGGLVLKLYKPAIRDDGSVMPDPERAPVTLKHGGNVVDADFMKAWLEENAGSDFVLRNQVHIIERKEIDGEPGVDNVVERPEQESSIDAPAPKQDGEQDGKEDQKPAE